MKKLRLLALMDEVLVPPDDPKDVDVTEAEWKTEFDVVTTLRDYYRDKRSRYGLDSLREYDAALRLVFSTQKAFARYPTAASFLRSARPLLRHKVADLTGEHQYTVDLVLDDMIERAVDLKLRLTRSAAQTMLDFGIVLTTQLMRFVRSGRHRLAL